MRLPCRRAFQVLTQESRHPILYLITDRHSLGTSDNFSALIELSTKATRAGVDMIQIREKDLTGRQLFELTSAIIAAVRQYGTKVMVNDRIDIALACSADGVHLASNSLPVPVARELLGNNHILGVSTHSLDQVQSAENGGADFVVYGPIFPTVSKLKYGAPVGLSSLNEVVAATKLPVIAIGGITEANYDSALNNGAAGIAAIGMFAKSDSLAKLVTTIKGSFRR